MSAQAGSWYQQSAALGDTHRGLAVTRGRVHTACGIQFPASRTVLAGEPEPGQACWACGGSPPAPPSPPGPASVGFSPVTPLPRRRARQGHDGGWCWYYRSCLDQDIHYARANSNGTVTAQCGAMFTPQVQMFSDNPAVAESPQPRQCCPSCTQTAPCLSGNVV